MGTRYAPPFFYIYVLCLVYTIHTVPYPLLSFLPDSYEFKSKSSSFLFFSLTQAQQQDLEDQIHLMRQKATEKEARRERKLADKTRAITDLEDELKSVERDIESLENREKVMREELSKTNKGKCCTVS